MRFASIADTSGGEARLTGLIVEADRGGIVIAALEGEEDDPDASRTVIERLAGEGRMVTIQRDGRQSMAIWREPDEPGYTEALIANLKPPLIPGPTGRLIRTGAPREMLVRIWKLLTKDRADAPLPSIVDLGRISRRGRDRRARMAS